MKREWLIYDSEVMEEPLGWKRVMCVYEAIRDDLESDQKDMLIFRGVLF